MHCDLVIAVSAACQPFMLLPDSSAFYISGIVIALPPTYWLLKDAKSRGAHVPHVIQPAVIKFWVFVIPVYLVWTRKWRGLLYLISHVVVSTLLTTAIFHLVNYLVWGPDAYQATGG